MATRTRCGLCDVNVSKQLPLAYAFVPGSDLPSVECLFYIFKSVVSGGQFLCSVEACRVAPAELQ